MVMAHLAELLHNRGDPCTELLEERGCHNKALGAGTVLPTRLQAAPQCRWHHLCPLNLYTSS